MNIGDVPEISCKIENFSLTGINGEYKMRGHIKSVTNSFGILYRISVFGA